MPAPTSGWTHFWKSERHAFDEVMRLATQYFAKRFCAAFHVQSGAHVFDYGCGPGFLADILIPRGMRFTGADINSYFIDICEKNHPTAHFFIIQADADQNTELLRQHLTQPADYIVLLSICQYLASTDSLERIIAGLKPHLGKNGVIVIADVVDDQTRSYRDALSLLFHTLKNGKVGAFLRFIRYVMWSQYANVAKSSQLQQFPESYMRSMSERQGLTCRLEHGLTFHPTRKNYVLQHPVQ